MLPILRLLLGKSAKASNAPDSNPTTGNSSKLRKLFPSTWKSNTTDQSFGRLNESQNNESEGYGVAVYRTTSEEEGKASAETVLQGIHVKQDIEWTQSKH